MFELNWMNFSFCHRDTPLYMTVAHFRGLRTLFLEEEEEEVFSMLNNLKILRSKHASDLRDSHEQVSLRFPLTSQLISSRVCRMCQSLGVFSTCLFAQAGTLPPASHHAVFVGRGAHQSRSEIYCCVMDCLSSRRVLVSSGRCASCALKIVRSRRHYLRRWGALQATGANHS